MPSAAADVDAGTRAVVLAVIGGFLRVLALVARAHALWPAAPLEHVTAAACAAVRAEGGGVPAEILLAIAQHESDLRPVAVSWRNGDGQRVDILWSDAGVHDHDERAHENTRTDTAIYVRAPASIRQASPPARGALACGLLSTIAPGRARCAELLDPDVAMAAGVAELGEWLRSPLSGGSLRLALAGYAGGVAGARAAREGIDAPAVRFADLFLARARALGYRDLKPGNVP
jgi:hypothetical protein